MATAFRNSKPHPVLWFATLAVAAALGLLLNISTKIMQEAGVDEEHPADAIIVYGAAEYVEEDLGRDDPDGVVELGDVVFAPGNLRVATQQASVGAQTQEATPMLTVSSTAKVADVDLDVDKSDLVAPGDKVTVSLPDGKDSPGTVASVGTSPETSATDPNADPTVPMVVM